MGHCLLIVLETALAVNPMESTLADMVGHGIEWRRWQGAGRGLGIASGLTADFDRR